MKLQKTLTKKNNLTVKKKSKTKNMNNDNYFDPTECNNGALAAMNALASTVESVTAPFPLFYTASKCGGGVNGASFPLYFVPINCPQDESIPNPSDNCLRIITPEDYKDGTIPLHPSQVNYFPTQSRLGNMFTSFGARPFSWYVPPNFTFIFFKTDPTLSTPASIPKLQQTGDYLEVDSCVGLPYLTDGTPFFNPPPPSVDFCQVGGSAVFDTAAPYLVILQSEDFSDTIIDMCLHNRQVNIGTNSLNDVWYPQSPGCDQYITNLCAAQNTSDICACFVQEKKLESLYPGINISVCSFGSMVSGKIEDSCAFNEKAYKTKAMLDKCVSFAQCLSNTTQDSMVKCMGEFVQFPSQLAVSPTVTPAQYSVETSVPSYSWIMLACSGAFLLLCFILLAFL